ncbi:hypothetical protein Clacol_004024 [Clathrus columnatus]|uniref:Uncharacterized protein n=1 Tax=Clathrus columnatus TaxID=1419009 RepID=A0AAV5AA60_9AGAM|nr:hypothetical protein Clacol_004024 [Clathrus columnatus]
MSSDSSADLYFIQNIETQNYILRGKEPGDTFRTGTDNRAVFRIVLVSESLYSISDVATGLVAGSSVNFKESELNRLKKTSQNQQVQIKRVQSMKSEAKQLRTTPQLRWALVLLCIKHEELSSRKGKHQQSLQHIMSSDIRAPDNSPELHYDYDYVIQNTKTQNYIVHGKKPGDAVRTGDGNPAVSAHLPTCAQRLATDDVCAIKAFRIAIVSELLYSITDTTTGLFAGPSVDGRTVIWVEHPKPWVIRPYPRPAPVGPVR